MHKFLAPVALICEHGTEDIKEKNRIFYSFDREENSMLGLN